METTEKTLLELHRTGNRKTKDKLEMEFPSLFKKQTELQKAINYLTESDAEVIKLRKIENIEGIANLIAEQKIAVIVRAINEKYVFKEGDYMYFPYFYRSPFRLVNVSYGCSYSYVAAPLCFKSEKLAKECGNNEEIKGYYEIYHLNKT